MGSTRPGQQPLDRGSANGSGGNTQQRERFKLSITERVQRAGGVLPQQQRQLQQLPRRVDNNQNNVVDIASSSSSSDEEVEVEPRKVMNTCREVRQQFRAQQALDARRRIPRRDMGGRGRGAKSIFGLTRETRPRAVMREEKEKTLEPKEEQDLSAHVRPEEKMKAIKMKQEEDAEMLCVLPQRCSLRSDTKLLPEGVEPRQLDHAERRVLVSTYYEFQEKMKNLTKDIADIKYQLEASSSSSSAAEPSSAKSSGRSNISGRTSPRPPKLSLAERTELEAFLTDLNKERQVFVQEWKQRVCQLGTLPPPKTEGNDAEAKWVKCTILGFNAYVCIVSNEARKYFGPPRLTRDDAIFDYQELQQAVTNDKVEEYLIKNQHHYDPDCLAVMLRNLGKNLDRRKAGKSADQRLRDAQDRRSMSMKSVDSDSENSDSDAPLAKRRKEPSVERAVKATTQVKKGSRVKKGKVKKMSQKALKEKAKRKMERLKQINKEVLAKSKGLKVSQPAPMKRGGRGPGKKVQAAAGGGSRRLIKRSA